MKQGSTGYIHRFVALCTIGLLFALPMPLQAEVLARLSSPATSLDQPVRLTLETEGEQTAAPDLSVLEQDFEILGRASQQSVSIINGAVSAKHSLILTLLPKHPGKLTVPSISFGDQQTRPLALEVAAESGDSRGVTDQRQAWVEMSLNKKTAYPEEEVILTLKLYQAAEVRGESLDTPQPSTGDTRLQLLDESSYTVEREGKPYRVLERNYGLYAYQTGTLEIAPVAFRGRSGGASIFSLLDDPFGRPQQRTSRVIRAQSKAVALQIKPIPAGFTGDHWLPARNVQLVATGIDSGTPLTAGKPVTRRIMLIADGLMSSQLPVIDPQTPAGVKPYEERPQLRDTPRKSGISGSRESVVTLIPTRAGSFTLPAIEVPWWNTTTGKTEIARLPAMTLEVKPGAAVASPATPPAAQPQASDRATAEPGDEAGIETASPVRAEPAGDPVHWIVWALAIAWLATLAGWWLSHRRRSKSELPAVPPEKPQVDSRPGSAAVQALIEAYREGDATGAREAWLKWGQQRWPANPPHNLTRLATRCPTPLAEAVIALEKALYSPADDRGWSEGFDPATLEEEPTASAAEQPAAEQLLPLNP